ERLDLAGRVVVVAGAGGGGIGTAISAMLAEAGAKVAAVDVRKEALDSVDSAMTALGGAPAYLDILADVRDPPPRDQACARAAGMGPLHGLVHGAGGLWPPQWAPLLDLDPAVFDEVHNLNLRSVLLTSQAVARRLVAQGSGGSIVHIASIAGLTAMPFGVPY